MQDLEQLTVVLADDHAIVREGIAALCAYHGFDVVGQCSDGIAAVEMVLDRKPEFAIIDLEMRGLTGLEAIRKLRAAGVNTKLIVLSVTRDESTVMQALRAGADAYLLKKGRPGTCWTPSISCARAAFTSHLCSAERPSSR